MPLKGTAISNDHTYEQLWEAIRREDKAAFEQLYRATVVPLTNQVYSLLRDREQAKDILQDIFITLYLRRHALPADINVAGYLSNAVRYKVSSVLRDRLTKAPHHLHLLKDAQEAELQQPDDPYDHSILKRKIREGIDSLPEKCRQAFLLNHYHSLSYKAIAHEMGISVKTVEKHISKALQVLRKELSEEQYLYIAIAMLTVFSY
ncbi:RNA polymerase sigma factor [Chitinophaga japonensis]|uniref:RNA polymerase sigma factor n=1 Tax=Chitinophaga japonensis TaxID=104662 RepID=UPI001315AE26|nr:RNA polymerase sigma-70 factor [Chitinophaga japonensis]